MDQKVLIERMKVVEARIISERALLGRMIDDAGLSDQKRENLKAIWGI